MFQSAKVGRGLQCQTKVQPASHGKIVNKANHCRQHQYHKLARKDAVSALQNSFAVRRNLKIRRCETAASDGAWDGSGTQEELMYKDECVTVDQNDEILGHDSKYACHKFIPEQPEGILHRAFSVFLFNSEGKLLLQQRAWDKITFPGVWTNTCCSHQLYGYSPTEVDTQEDIAKGQSPGTVRAAIRKLGHELGIDAAQLPAENFKFLTRLHYCAGDATDDGEPNGWGEHELDYILFIQANVDVEVNPEEIHDSKYVTLAELQEMMAPESGLKWSPWFRIIAEKFLAMWWEDLDSALTTDKYLDQEVHQVL
ncbi:hypothetical protein CYMTET_48849 [Cymbomonas tetramitiformis]|uniref:isopentenyl-diphosphate Delta-isomerase n=1 Tax=Cymbomonas tetramitiformis TaxID=36881 RepID=A0AAE0BSN2_9CHLO|nr:hypothetical protein CYMTET_48849 [Cymbomonas tetramitiformis]|eukprot:gene22369-26986_t